MALRLTYLNMDFTVESLNFYSFVLDNIPDWGSPRLVLGIYHDWDRLSKLAFVELGAN